MEYAQSQKNSNTQNKKSKMKSIMTNPHLKHRIIQTIVDLGVICIIMLVVALLFFKVNPQIRFFTCNDTEIFFPYYPDTISFWVEGIYTIIGPIIFILLIELLNARLLPCKSAHRLDEAKQRRRKFFICFFHAVSLFALGCSITLCLTEIGKRSLGRLRPHFIAVCDPDWSLVRCTNTSESGSYFNSIYTGGNFCRGDPAKVKEARHSFPAGHSSFAWFTMLFLILYLEARLKLLKLRYIKTLLQLVAFICAYITSITRISDHAHRESDVIAGSALGIIIALFITLIVGRVLWEYECDKGYSDYDLKARNYQTKENAEY